MLKKKLRKIYLEKRFSTTSSYILNASLSISNALLKLPIWNFSNYHIFLPIKNKKEIDTNTILSILLGKDKNVLVPKMVQENNLECYLLTDNTTLKENKWGVPEPQDGIKIEPKNVDVIFIPLLAYDNKGNRVGYGKGYYDRFLKECKPDVLKIGLSIFPAVEAITDVSKEDIPLDYCITPEKTYRF